MKNFTTIEDVIGQVFKKDVWFIIVGKGLGGFMVCQNVDSLELVSIDFGELYLTPSYDIRPQQYERRFVPEFVLKATKNYF